MGRPLYVLLLAVLLWGCAWEVGGVPRPPDPPIVLDDGSGKQAESLAGAARPGAIASGSVASGYAATATVESTSAAPPTLGVAAIRLNAGASLGAKLDRAAQAIDLVLKRHGAQVDLIVTPEYTFTSNGSNTSYPEHAIDFACNASFDDCTMTAGGGRYSDDLRGTIETLRDRASARGVTLVLGSVTERFDATGIAAITSPYVYFNVALVIGVDGKISIKRKTSGDWLSSCAMGSACVDAIAQRALATVRPFGVVLRDGATTARVLPVICGERDHVPMLARLAGQGGPKVDLLVSPEREGDIPYAAIMAAIQDGQWNAALFGWDWGIRGLFIDAYVAGHELARPGAYLVVAEGSSSTAAIIQLAEPSEPLAQLVVDDAYVFGVVPLPR